MAVDKQMRRSKLRWMYATLPANLASGPMGTLVALYILQLGGGVIDVAYAATLSSLVAILATIFWGRLTDMMGKRKIFMLASYIGMAASFLALLYVHNALGVIWIYAAYAFIANANTPTLSLLVMETSPRPRLTDAFSRLQFMSSIGATIGYIVAYLVTGFFPLTYLIITLLLISTVSIVMSIKLIYEPRVLMESATLIKDTFIIMTRFIIAPFLFIIRLPTLKIFRRMFGVLSLQPSGKSTLSYFAIFSFAALIFYFGSGIFNTVYPVGLNRFGLSQSEVFAIFSIANGIQAAVFYSYRRMARHDGNIRTAKNALVMRGLAYIGIGLVFLLTTGILFYGLNLLIYSISSGLAYSLFYIPSNIILFKLINNRQRGIALGAYSSLTGVGSISGALISGYIAHYIGFWFAFIIAGAMMLMTLAVYMKLKD